MTHPFSIAPPGTLGKPEPFTLNVPDESIAEFRTLLELSRIAPETWEGKQGQFGTTRDWLTNAKSVWLRQFSWRRWEERINSFPNFKMDVEDSLSGKLSIHFAALFSKRSDAVPVIFMHGWPGSFMEFLPMLSLLAEKYTPDTLPYHVIVPSLPGFTLSSGPPLDRDFTIEDCSRIINQLMVNLGFGTKGYMAQGGDVGSMLAPILAATTSECKATHVNLMGTVVDDKDIPNLTPSEQEHLQRVRAFRTTGLAWIGEKLVEWTDSQEPLELDTILGLVSLYWFTDTFPRSIWPYRSFLRLRNNPLPKNNEKPLGYSRFHKEIEFVPAALSHKAHPNMGGHFAALEQPNIFLADVEDFVAKHKGLIKG